MDAADSINGELRDEFRWVRSLHLPLCHAPGASPTQFSDFCRGHVTPAKLPWDEQVCGMYIGPYSQANDEVSMQWRTEDGVTTAFPNLENQRSAEWFIGEERNKKTGFEAPMARYSVDL